MMMCNRLHSFSTDNDYPKVWTDIDQRRMQREQVQLLLALLAHALRFPEELNDVE